MECGGSFKAKLYVTHQLSHGWPAGSRWQMPTQRLSVERLTSFATQQLGNLGKISLPLAGTTFQCRQWAQQADVIIATQDAEAVQG